LLELLVRPAPPAFRLIGQHCRLVEMLRVSPRMDMTIYYHCGSFES
jgi:hypothetical protein